VAGLRQSRRWKSWMWRSWAGVVTHCERLDVLPSSLKWHWRQLMVEKITLGYLQTALVDIPAVSMPIACSLISHLWHCVVTQLHILVAFYCPQHKVHLCNEHVV
jgi:hypothetical protein